MKEEKAPGDAMSLAGVTDVDNEVDDALGLDGVGEPASKKRRLSGPKLRKTREELLDEEISKLQAKYEETLKSMRDPSTPMPTSASVGKIERSAGKLEEAKANSSFANSQSLQELVDALAAFKEAVRVTGLYLPANGTPKKTHAESFVQGLKKLEGSVLTKFPEPVLGHFHHLCHQKDATLFRWAMGFHLGCFANLLSTQIRYD